MATASAAQRAAHEDETHVAAPSVTMYDIVLHLLWLHLCYGAWVGRLMSLFGQKMSYLSFQLVVLPFRIGMSFGSRDATAEVNDTAH